MVQTIDQYKANQQEKLRKAKHRLSQAHRAVSRIESNLDNPEQSFNEYLRKKKGKNIVESTEKTSEVVNKTEKSDDDWF